MISSLYDTDSNLITNFVESAIITPDVIKIKNRLLDGTYHIQSIGDRVDSIAVVFYVDETNKAIIDSAYSTNEPIKLIRKDKYYIGAISDTPKWKMFSADLYEGLIKMVVESEGDI